MISKETGIKKKWTTLPLAAIHSSARYVVFCALRGLVSEHQDIAHAQASLRARMDLDPQSPAAIYERTEDHWRVAD